MSAPESRYATDRFLCWCADKMDANPGKYGMALSPQGEPGESWGGWWLFRVFEKAKREAEAVVG